MSIHLPNSSRKPPSDLNQADGDDRPEEWRDVGNHSATSRARDVFLCWLYARLVNKTHDVQPRWICRTLGLKNSEVNLIYLDTLIDKYLEIQEVTEKYLTEFIKKEYPALDNLCRCVLMLVLVEKQHNQTLSRAVVISEAVKITHTFSPEGYQIVNALAEKLWATDVESAPADPLESQDTSAEKAACSDQMPREKTDDQKQQIGQPKKDQSDHTPNSDRKKPPESKPDATATEPKSDE